ncbi:hypothetical protein [Streptomyces globosus]
MLPTPEQAWLTDDRGAAYTSELRFVAVDRTAAEGAAAGVVAAAGAGAGA